MRRDFCCADAGQDGDCKGWIGRLGAIYDYAVGGGQLLHFGEVVEAAVNDGCEA